MCAPSSQHSLGRPPRMPPPCPPWLYSQSPRPPPTPATTQSPTLHSHVFHTHTHTRGWGAGQRHVHHSARRRRRTERARGRRVGDAPAASGMVPGSTGCRSCRSSSTRAPCDGATAAASSSAAATHAMAHLPPHPPHRGPLCSASCGCELDHRVGASIATWTACMAVWLCSSHPSLYCTGVHTPSVYQSGAGMHHDTPAAPVYHHQPTTHRRNARPWFVGWGDSFHPQRTRRLMRRYRGDRREVWGVCCPKSV